jgi:hypothetical protein
MMKVLFIGATGYIGSHVVPFLKEKFELTLAALESGEVTGLPVTAIDICCWETVESYIKNARSGGKTFDAVVYCATANYRHNSHQQEEQHRYYERCIDVNVRGAYHVFDAAWRGNIPKVVHIGSMTAMLGFPHYEYIDENCWDQPRDLYAATKIFGEHVGRFYAFRPDELESGCKDCRPPMQVICLRLGQPFDSVDQWCHGPHKGSRMPLCMKDIANAITCALFSDVLYGIYPVVSDVENPRVASSTYRELGYRPGWKFTPDGLIKVE